MPSGLEFVVVIDESFFSRRARNIRVGVAGVGLIRRVATVATTTARSRLSRAVAPAVAVRIVRTRRAFRTLAFAPTAITGTSANVLVFGRLVSMAITSVYVVRFILAGTRR